MRRLAILAIVLCAPVLEAGAQPTARDTATANAIKTARDSITCVVAPKAAADRCSRARVRMDSIRAGLTCPRALAPTIPAGGWFCPAGSLPPPEPVAAIDVGFTWRSSTHFASRTIDSLAGPVPNVGVDTVTVCAVVTFPDSSRKVGWPPVRILTIGDSAIYGLRGGNPLSVMCGGAVAAVTTVADSVPVTWSLHWLNFGRRVLRPVATYAKP